VGTVHEPETQIELNKSFLSTHKFGIAVPKTVSEVLDLDRIKGTTHWRDAINLEANNVNVALKELQED
jgi:hypothetical protein